MSKATIYDQAQMEEAVREVAGLLSQGHALADLREFVERRHPDLPQAKVIEGALDTIVDQAGQIAEKGQHIALDSYRSLYRELRKIGDYAGALRAATAMEKLTLVVAHDAQTQQDINLRRLLKGG